MTRDERSAHRYEPFASPSYAEHTCSGATWHRGSCPPHARSPVGTDPTPGKPSVPFRLAGNADAYPLVAFGSDGGFLRDAASMAVGAVAPDTIFSGLSDVFG